MTKYIFIDNWVLGSLRMPGFHSALRDYVRRNGYIVLLSSLSLVELYNPGWNNSGGPDRTQRAVKFYSEVPCVVVNPRDLWNAEIEKQLDPLDDLPIRLDLKELDSQLREETLLRFLRADDLYLAQGHDVREWDQNYKCLKEQWLTDVERIIEDACKSGNLIRGEKRRLVQLSEHKERFLFSLDLRHAPPNKVDAILTHQVERRSNGEPVRLSAVRLSSLVFWYLYIDINPSNQIRHQGSDIGDLYHLSLLPYCRVFTADKSMYRLLRRIKEPFEPLSCEVLTKPLLQEMIGA